MSSLFTVNWHYLVKKLVLTLSAMPLFLSVLYHGQWRFWTDYLNHLNYISSRTDHNFEVKLHQSHTNMFFSSPLITSIMEWNSLPHHITQNQMLPFSKKTVREHFLGIHFCVLLLLLFNNPHRHILVKCSVQSPLMWCIDIMDALEVIKWDKNEHPQHPHNGRGLGF